MLSFQIQQCGGRAVSIGATAEPIVVEVSDDVLESLWAYCDGSARVLMESLVPALRDYAGGRALSAKLVDSVATTVLFLARKSGGK